MPTKKQYAVDVYERRAFIKRMGPYATRADAQAAAMKVPNGFTPKIRVWTTPAEWKPLTRK